MWLGRRVCEYLFWRMPFHRHVCMYVCMYICKYVGLYMHTYICTHVHMTLYVCMYVRMYVCMYVCMYALYMYLWPCAMQRISASLNRCMRYMQSVCDTRQDDSRFSLALPISNRQKARRSHPMFCLCSSRVLGSPFGSVTIAVSAAKSGNYRIVRQMRAKCRRVTANSCK